MEPLRGSRDRDMGGAFPYSRRLTPYGQAPLGLEGSGASRRGRDRDWDLGGAFRYSRRLTRLMDKPLWGLRVLKFDGAIAPRVLRFDAPPARGLLWAPYIYRRRPLMIKPSQPGFRPWENRPTSLRSRKCIPPFGAVRHQRGESHRRWLITVVLIMPYDTER